MLPQQSRLMLRAFADRRSVPTFIPSRDIRNQTLKNRCLLYLAGQPTRIDWKTIDLDHPYKRIVLYETGQTPLVVPLCHLQRITNDLRLAVSCTLAHVKGVAQLLCTEIRFPTSVIEEIDKPNVIDDAASPTVDVSLHQR